MSKSVAIALFLALLFVGTALGVARDLYSHEQAQLSGEVVEVIAGDREHKSYAARTPRLKVRLTDGRTVYVVIAEARRFKASDIIALSEMAMPWGPIWYKLKAE
jgi:hypothetical protein